jgi:competence protein ComEC
MRTATRLAVLALLALPAGVVPAQSRPPITISAIMIDPTTVPDDRGEWLQLHNDAERPVSIAGWRLLSGRDPGFTIPAGIVIPAKSDIILARNADPATNGGVRAVASYTGLSFANAGDWLALRDPAGVTRDSVAWGRAPRGVALRPHGGLFTVIPAAPPGDSRRPPASRPVVPRPAPASPASPVPSTSPHELVVRVLDVGQGDAILIQNGGSTVLIDGGPNPRVLGAHLDALGLDGTTIDAVILTHAHADHYQGLRELFASRRHITVRYLWENQDPSPNRTLATLRDSIGARVAAGTLVYRDTDDPCATGQALCVITLKGGARLDIMRPDLQGQGPNNRSPALKLVGPDSASFTMWIAGDAEQDAQGYFERALYARVPGMKVDVLKADHHGSCNGVTDRYLNLLRPGLVVVSLGAVNDYGHMHEQAKATYARHGIPWLRTDQNGTITLRSAGTPGSRYTVSVERGRTNMSGPSDRRSTQGGCGGM